MHDLDGVHDRRQGISQLVAEHREELVLHAICLPQLFRAFRNALLECLIQLAKLFLGVAPFFHLGQQSGVRRCHIAIFSEKLRKDRDLGSQDLRIYRFM
jgi:hypothetical protein